MEAYRAHHPSVLQSGTSLLPGAADALRALHGRGFRLGVCSNKPVAFVGYGGVGGARAIEQLRLNAIELQMAPIRTGVHILFPDYLAVIKEGKKLGDLPHLNQGAKDMLDQLAWWTGALKAARDNALQKAA